MKSRASYAAPGRLFVITTATLTAIIGVLLGILLSMPREASAPSSRPTLPWGL